MTIPSLPAQGDTSWYAYAQALDAAARAGVDPDAVDTLVASLIQSETDVHAALLELIPAPGAGGTTVYNTVQWDSTTSSWPARPAVPTGVPVFWMSARYPTAGAPPGALADDVWYPHLDELT